MKRMLILTAALFWMAAVNAQTISKARNYLYDRRYESAKQALWSYANDDNATPDTWYWLTESYLGQKDPDSARDVLVYGTARILNRHLKAENYPILDAAWGHVLLEEGRAIEARQRTDAALRANRYKDPLLLWAVARANIDSKNGDRKYAIVLLNKAVHLDKDNPALYQALGDAYRRLNDGTHAVANYKKALKLDPSLAAAMYGEGCIYKTQNNTDIYLDRFRKAYAMDTTYAPVIDQLYRHYYNKDVDLATHYLAAYIRHSDPDARNDYKLADLLFLGKKYPEAIARATAILGRDHDDVQPRLYKLLAYSYAAIGDSATALTNMNLYFDNQKKDGMIAKDYDLKARLVDAVNTDKTPAMEWYRRALKAETDSNQRLVYMNLLADRQKQLGDREREAHWRERIYTTKADPTNLDLYNWGMALYEASDYQRADSVFAGYEEKYPDQIYGYLWRARCNALIDSNMKLGLAVPHYKDLLEVARQDTATYKNILVSTYGYLGAYEANTTKDYRTSLEYFNKILQLDPDNSEAKKYSGILNKWLREGKDNG